MATEKIKQRLDELCELGDNLYLRFLYERQLEALDSETSAKLAERVKKLPRFNNAYQSWYSEALELLRQTFPNRVDDFVAYLNPPKTRKELDSTTYTISDAIRGISASRYGKVTVDPRAALVPLEQQIEIIKSVRLSIDSVLVNLRNELQANLFDDDLQAARELNKKGFSRAGGMIAGVVIEGHLKELVSRHKVPIKARHPTIGHYNDALKDATVVDLANWRRVQSVADMRNLCAHKGSSEPEQGDVSRMIDDVADLIKRLS